MRVARAKLKPIEQLDPEYRCCQQKIDCFIQDQRVFEVDLDSIGKEQVAVCDFCGNTTFVYTIWFKEAIAAPYGKDCNCIPLEYIDIEESEHDPNMPMIQTVSL